MRHLLHIMLLAVVLSLLTGCKDDGTNVVDHPTNPELVPTMTTSDVQTVISDSGHTRYRINAKLWNMYAAVEHYNEWMHRYGMDHLMVKNA